MQDQERPAGADGTAGIVRHRTFVAFRPPRPLRLDSGKKLGPVSQVYETYGQLNQDRSNAVLVFHALSGDHHAAGRHSPSDSKPGWWDNMIGPGKAFDTDRVFVICANVIGGCRGSTGPSSRNPATKKPYGAGFPVVTLRDMVRAQKALIDHLGIKRLLAVTGGSMGGMMALHWAIEYPDSVRCVIPIATAAYQSAQNIALQEVARRAIMADPNWRGGNYYGGPPPEKGLAVARMMGHISYLSDRGLQDKFGRRLQNGSGLAYALKPEFRVESYLDHQGEVFVKRFDANTYLYVTKAIDYFDLTDGSNNGGGFAPALAQKFRRSSAKFLLLSFISDWLYPVERSDELEQSLKLAGRPVRHETIHSTYGHDACFLEADRMAPVIREFLGGRKGERDGVKRRGRKEPVKICP
ncbi:homoserine O-acetyltransferase [bacterium]|nr:homoserine O-acetyltransferase [bacterium]